MREIIVGTRGSQLALRQADLVIKLLQDKLDGFNFNIKIIKTTGDLIIDNSNVSSSKITDLPDSGTYNLDNFTIQNYGKFKIKSDQTFNLSNLNISSNNGYLYEGTVSIATAEISGYVYYAQTTSSQTTVSGTATVKNGGYLIGNNYEASNSFYNIVVQSGGTITHDGNTTSETNRLNLNVTNNLDIQSGGSINVQGKGYSAGNGPGKPISGNAGGSYGGYGYGNSGPVYGSYTQPNNLGSGGSSSAGGGAVKLTVGGTLTVNGSINANGQPFSWWNTSATGSGGSVWINTVILEGNGAIEARGGLASDYTQGAGGGRIALYYTTNNHTGSILTSSNRDGSAGTIYKKSSAQSYGDLIINNNN